MEPKSLRSSIRRSPIALGAGIFALATGSYVGCSSADRPTPAGTPTVADSATGAVGLKLTIPGGAMLNAVNWVITGPNGAATTVQTGTANVQNSTVISFLVSNIAPGSNYNVALTGTSTDGMVTCVGSAAFDVAPRTTTNVSVLLQCNTPASDAGNGAINGQTFNCASVTSVVANSTDATVGGSVNLLASASAVDSTSLTYTWSASGGTLSSTSIANPVFTCTAPGLATVTVSVSDGPVPDGGSCNAAVATASIQVQCDAVVDSGAPAPACSLGVGGAIKHVIYIQFDNTHLTRDRALVPSDLEQMPNLLNFIRGNGTMMANDHTVLISHTAGGIISTLTGVYPDRHGEIVSNSNVRISATGTFSFPSSFSYWTDPVVTNGPPNVVGPNGQNAPAPWVTYTRAGCDFGAVSAANTILENTSTAATGDITKVFGSGSPEFLEVQQDSAADAGAATKAIPQANYVGLGVHCAQNSPRCAAANGGKADLLPSEPGGYAGFNGLFGAKYVNPVLTGQAWPVALKDLNNQPITDSFGNPGFPGFDGMLAAVSLSYIASMQEHGIPVTFAYVSDAHDQHGPNAQAFGPGAPGYTQQLRSYDAAFGAFFTRLAADGIDKTNTLFVFTVDEGDHFVGGSPTPANCDGVNIPCDWTTNNQVGELTANIDKLVQGQFPALFNTFLSTDAGAPDNFTVHGDDAPTFYLSKRGVGALSQTDPDTRNFERTIANVTAVNPYTGATDSLLVAMIDQAGQQAVHMFTTGDPARNPTFTFFGDADYFVTDFPSTACLTCINPGFAWNHGDIQKEIGQTWVGYVGPGVRNQPDQTVFTDHTDVRPTINSVLGLHDSYLSDGRVVTQALQSTGYAAALTGNIGTIEALGDAYKQINAPFGPFAASIVLASTAALRSNDPSDTTYTSVEASIVSLTGQRDTLATSIKTALDGAEFGGTPIATTQAQAWVSQAQSLVASAASLAASVH
jgi:hypothetical protein